MTEKTKMTSGERVTDILIAVLLLVPATILYGLVLRDLWRWFVVPLGLMPINLGEALGLSLTGSTAVLPVALTVTRTQEPMGAVEAMTSR